MAEPKYGNYYSYLTKIYKVKSFVRHQVYPIVGVTSIKRYVVPLIQLQATVLCDGVE